MSILEITANYYQYFLRGTRTTILVALVTVFCGALLGCAIALMRLSKIKVLNWFSRLYITVIRGTPMLVQLYIVYFQLDFIKYPSGSIFGVDLERAIPCIIALSMNSAAYIAEIIRAGIQAVDKGQMEAARVLRHERQSGHAVHHHAAGGEKHPAGHRQRVRDHGEGDLHYPILRHQRSDVQQRHRDYGDL